MKNLFTLCMCILVGTAFAQNSKIPQPKMYHRATSGNIKPVAHGAGQSNARSSQVCDTLDYLDYNAVNEITATNLGLNFHGSWYASTPTVYGQEISNFVDTFSENNQYMKYVGSRFDSLLFNADPSTGLWQFYPRASTTLTLDSVLFRCGIWGDTALGGKMDNDSVLIKIYAVNGIGNTLNTNTATPVQTVVIAGHDQLSQFFTGQDIIGTTIIPVGYTFAHGQSFAVRLDYINKDSSSHFIISYTYSDSCGTITLGGNNYSSPAYPSPMADFESSFWADIYRNSGSNVATTHDAGNDFAYSAAALPGVPANCRFVYTQNWEIIPFVRACVDFSASITASSTQACPNTTVSLQSAVVGTNDPGLSYQWSASSGQLSSTSANTTTLTMPTSGNVTVTLLVITGTDTARTTQVITNNGVTIQITNSTPITIPCSGSVPLLSAAGGVQSGLKYTWTLGGAKVDSVSNHTATTAGTFTVTVVNSKGCQASAQAVVSYPGVSNNVDFTVPGHICKGVSATFTNTSTYTASPWSSSWDMGDGNGLVATDAVYTYNSQGSYTIVLTMDSAGCKFVSPGRTITVAATSVCTGINELTFSENVSIFPNPNNGNFNITITGLENNVSIKVFNVLGSEVKNFSSVETGATFNKNFDFSDLASGTYMVKIQSGNNAVVKRITISK